MEVRQKEGRGAEERFEITTGVRCYRRGALYGETGSLLLPPLERRWKGFDVWEKRSSCMRQCVGVWDMMRQMAWTGPAE
jgi:hypothetical protein